MTLIKYMKAYTKTNTKIQIEFDNDVQREKIKNYWYHF